MIIRPKVEEDAADRSADGPVLRPATSADLAALTRLEAQAFTGDRLSRRSFRRFLSGPTAVTIVSVADGCVVGYALVLFRKDTKVARLYSLARDGSWQGRGIGAGLLAAAEAQARARGADAMRLEVRVDNGPARALYAGRGYVESGTLPAYYDDGTDAICMYKRLRDPAR
jgi:ribosomal protein S18 acetylase RimI-like enzyme